jgi:uncharacterized protein YlaI
MRTHILTDQEREIINEYLKTGKRLENFRVLLYRCQKAKETLAQDTALIKQFLEKAETSQ